MTKHAIQQHIMYKNSLGVNTLKKINQILIEIISGQWNYVSFLVLVFLQICTVYL